MHFNFLTCNHGGTAGAEAMTPIIDYMRAALSKCGHETTVVLNDLYKGPINLVIERFDNPHFNEWLLAAIHNHSIRVGIIATELIIGGKIPYARHGLKYVSGGHLHPKMIDQRIAGFGMMAGHVDFIWSFLERTAEEYKNASRVSEFFPVGHTMGVPAELRRSPKDIDIVFFGKSTPHREAVLRSFASSGIRAVAFGNGFSLGYMPGNRLKSVLDRAKIGLNLTLHDRGDSVDGVDPRFASSMRIAEMLDREVCIVSEEIPLDNPYRPFMISGEPEELAATCKNLLQSGEWKERGKELAAAYREQMDVTKICAPVIDRTLRAIGID